MGKLKKVCVALIHEKSKILIGLEWPLVLSERLIVPERLSGSFSTLA
jgi:hypothetical protein